VVNITAGNTNAAPTTSITSPAANASYTTPVSITINASAADTDGTVAKVEFYQGTTKLGEDTSSPYSFVWSNVPAGSYALTSKATDNSGATGTSSVVSITVTTSPGGNCGNIPQYVANGGYVAGSIVQNAGSQYECKPFPFSGWCNGAAWAYAPGTGTYWGDAWILKGSCQTGARTASPTVTGDAEFADAGTDGLTAYPNPGASGKEEVLSLDFGSAPGAITVQLKDTQGNAVWASRYDSTGKSQKITLPVLSPGLYVLHVKSSTRTWSRKYLVK
jgi:hypothetical protein